MKRALVTGATGFVGSHVARFLVEQGYEVQVLVRSTSNRKNLEGLPLKIFEGDLANRESLKPAVVGCSEIYHVAADYSFWSLNPQKMHQSNVEGTQNLLAVCAEQPATDLRKIVYTSTVGTLGLSSATGINNEDTPLLPDQMANPYKKTKFAAENVAQQWAQKGLPVVIVNPSAPIGAGDIKPTPTGQIIVDFINGRMPAYLDTGLNVVHVKDVAQGHWLAAQKGRVGERYILGHQNMSLSQILNVLSEIAKKPKPRVKIPYSLAWTVGFLSTKIADWVTHRPPLVALNAVRMAKHKMYFDSSKAVRELGLVQTPVQEAFVEAVNWFKKNGYTA